MDVSILMRDLSVEHMVNVQSSLDQKIEKKKEELRQMVGRRYRDVLEASNAVKRLVEISDELIVELCQTRNVSCIFNNDSFVLPKKNLMLAVQDFVLLKTFLFQAGRTKDSVSDVFCVLLVEAFYRKFATKTSQFEAVDVSLDANCTLQNNFDRLILTKIELADHISEELGRQTDWHIVAGCLAAMTLLKQLSVEALLDLYLQDTIFLSLKSSTISLIGIIRMLRDTTQTVNDVFGQGGALVSALQTITSSGWYPETIKLIIDDQLSDYTKLLEKEITKINAVYSKDQILSISTETIINKCSEWVQRLCVVAGNRVRAMCEHFEQTEQVIEFIVAINQLFQSEWPTVVSSTLIYENLFGDSILQRCKLLIDRELNALKKDFIKNFSSCNSNPMPLFQKHTIKFNANLSSGVSLELFKLVQKMFDGMKEIFTNINKYVNIGRESNVLKDALTESVLTMVQSFFDHFNIPKEAIELNDDNVEVDLPCLSFSKSTGVVVDAQAKWLSTFRLFLAFVQHEPSLFCLCMNRNTKKIAYCNKILYAATDYSLCNFMNYVIEECVKNSKLSLMPKICASESNWLDLIEEFETLKLEDLASHVNIPIHISHYYFHFLYSICRQINNHSIGHLFTRNIIKFISKKLGKILALNLKECVFQCSAATSICTQLLFDCKALFLMFLNHEFIEAAQSIEAKIDVFDFKLLDGPLCRNAKLFVQRTSILFGQLQTESKTDSFNRPQDSVLSVSYSALVDIMPKLNDVRRLTLIPRLSKFKSDDENRLGKGYVKDKDVLSSGNTMSEYASGKLPSASSFTSFYGKISTGWFKN